MGFAFWAWFSLFAFSFKTSLESFIASAEAGNIALDEMALENVKGFLRSAEARRKACYLVDIINDSQGLVKSGTPKELLDYLKSRRVVGDEDGRQSAES